MSRRSTIAAAPERTEGHDPSPTPNDALPATDGKKKRIQRRLNREVIRGLALKPTGQSTDKGRASKVGMADRTQSDPTPTNTGPPETDKTGCGHLCLEVDAETQQTHQMKRRSTHSDSASRLDSTAIGEGTTPPNMSTALEPLKDSHTPAPDNDGVSESATTNGDTTSITTVDEERDPRVAQAPPPDVPHRH